MTQYISVALPLPVRQEFDYRIPAAIHDSLQIGQRVRVPFGSRQLTGYCVGHPEAPSIEPSRIKPIDRVLDSTPLVGPELLQLTRWMSNYYYCSWGEALSAVLPAGVKRGQAARQASRVELALSRSAAEDFLAEVSPQQAAQARVVRVLLASQGGMELQELARQAGTSVSPIHTLTKRKVLTIQRVRSATDFLEETEVEPTPPLTLNPEQRRALTEVQALIGQEAFGVGLLWGVTGSGKTEVYLQAIESVRQLGKQSIVLVPEIALTPQTVRRFRARFERVAVLHSGLTDSQRRDQWTKIARGEADVVIGPRSAVFAPVLALGLIVIDEEHEPSFKQNTTPRYQARDVAIMRAHFSQAVVLLGSATPSLESFANAGRGKFELSILPNRVARRPLPPIELVDMTHERHGKNQSPILSHSLERHIRAALERKEQIILLRNRRGYSTFLGCFRCGYVAHCPRCDVGLTYHASYSRAICHYCNHEEKLDQSCPECLTGRLKYLGSGTQKIEAIVEKLFPGVRLARMDSDTMVHRKAYEKTLGQFESGAIDLLIGTQMISKGLDFPNVTLVGVLSADSILHFPDFRSAERTFQLLTQVAGRAGRGPKGGRVIVQTTMPKHYSIQAAARHDFKAFAEQDLQFRRELGYPPFSRLARILGQGKAEPQVRAKLSQVADRVRQGIDGSTCQVLGPAPCPIRRIEDKFRWHLLIKAQNPRTLTEALQRVQAPTGKRGAVSITVDVDPYDMV